MKLKKESKKEKAVRILSADGSMTQDNGFGVAVAVKCVSCKWFERDGETNEGVCHQFDYRVKRQSACGMWDMQERLRTVGMEQGRVHRPEFIRFIVENAERVNAGKIGTLIQEFEDKHGWRFLRI